MKNKVVITAGILLVFSMFLSACSPASTAFSELAKQLSVAQAASSTQTQEDSSSNSAVNPSSQASIGTESTAVTPSISEASDLLAAYEAALENIYTTVSPQVVNITVVTPANLGDFQFFQGDNNTPQPEVPQFSQGLGSGFIWDAQGHIVTNNHVVDGASEINVTFQDGTSVPASIVGADPYSDLAVIKVDVSADMLHPVTMADSTQVKVGEIAIAIGNPFGYEGSMTVGNVSGIGRDLPAGQLSQSTGGYYSIPNVIQTDASINPGNSGGVLVNDQGQVIGVTSAIESASGSSSGIGFAIPSEIVMKVVPVLIENGRYDHPYLGISGTSMTPDIAQAMDLPSDTRGALVIQVTSGGPSDKAGLKASTSDATINGSQVTIGGDVITAIDDQPVRTMSDIIAYLANHTMVGQEVALTILRDGEIQTVQVTLGSRPAQ